MKHEEPPECQHCKVRFKSVFCDLDKEELSTLNANKGCNIFKKKQVVFHEGAWPHGLFCVNNGKIKISKTGSEGKEQIVRMAKEGDIIGYRALLCSEQYSCSATVLEDASVCFIPKDTFFNLADKNADLSKKIIKLLTHDLKEAEHKITDIAQKTVRERLAEALLFLKETYGFEKDNATLNVILSREEIANIVGTATESIIRLLAEFKQDELIDFVGKKIKILNQKTLVHTANLYD